MPMSDHLTVRTVADESDWQRVVDIRTEVFIREQSCPPEVEWDGHDDTSRHLLGWLDATAVAATRWRVVPHDERLVAKLERLAVLPPFRGRGFGRTMVVAGIEDARAAGFGDCLIHAQARLEEYYAGMGFVRFGETFEEAGIPHVRMIRLSEAMSARPGDDQRPCPAANDGQSLEE